MKRKREETENQSANKKPKQLSKADWHLQREEKRKNSKAKPKIKRSKLPIYNPEAANKRPRHGLVIPKGFRIDQQTVIDNFKPKWNAQSCSGLCFVLHVCGQSQERSLRLLKGLPSVLPISVMTPTLTTHSGESDSRT